MVRKNIPLVLPFRYIKESDATKRFQNQLSPINSVDLEFLAEINQENRYVIVYESGNNILAFIVIWDHETHFELELVEANRLHRTSLHPGTVLVNLVDDISRQFNYQRIVLYSVQNRISYYENLGYVQLDETVNDPNYGILTKMEKLL